MTIRIQPSRRAILKTGGALVVGGSAWALLRYRDRISATLLPLGLALALLALIAAPFGFSDLSQRAVLWTGGARVALDGGAPVGTWDSVIAPVHHALLPTFDFPFHAHDTFLQAAADGGFATWLALGWAAWGLEELGQVEGAFSRGTADQRLGIERDEDRRQR